MKTLDIHAWPRERSRYAIGPNDISGAENACTTVYHDDGTITQHPFSVSRNSLPDGVERMFDLAGASQSYYRDCVHEKSRYALGDASKAKPGGGEWADFHVEIPTSYFAGELTTTSVPLSLITDKLDRIMIPKHAPSLFGPNNCSWPLNAVSWREVAKDNEKQIVVTLDQGFDLVNFLLQWQDVVHIIKRNFTKAGWHDRAHQFLNKRQRVTPGSAVRATASQYLEHKFGQETTISDIVKLGEILSDWLENADKLVAASGKRHTFHNGTSVFPVEDHSKVWSFNLFGTIGGHVYARDYYPDGAQVNSSTQYIYTCPEASGMLARLQQFCDSVGLRKNWAIAWEAIDFTFVLNWFVDVQAYLYSKSVDWFSCDVLIEDYCRTGHCHSVREIYWEFNHPAYPDGLTKVKIDLGKVYSEYFVRERDIPNLEINNVVEPKHGWTFTRVCIANALIVNQVPVLIARAKDISGFPIRLWKRAEADAHKASQQEAKLLKKFKRIIRRKFNYIKRIEASKARFYKQKEKLLRARERAASRNKKRGGLTITNLYFDIRQSRMVRGIGRLPPTAITDWWDINPSARRSFAKGK